MDTSSDQPEAIASSLVSLIKKQLDDLDPISRAVSIYRVHPNFRQLNEKTYTPQMVSIGPFHHGKAELQPWEVNKLRYLQAFLDRTKKSLEDCIELVKRLEGSARACYRERIDMTSNEFVKMMLVDSCFIIEAIWRRGNNWPQPADYWSNPELILFVKRDMILSENQIPFFVPRALFCLGFSNLGEDKFLELTMVYFSGLVLTATKAGDREIIFRNVKRNPEAGLRIEHFADLLRMCHLPTSLEKPFKADLVVIPKATSLHEAGMKFETGTSKCLPDIKYNNGIVEMPKFFVDDDSECLLRNIIALETCHYPYDSYIIDYIYFMDTATDVDLLVQKGIIVNNMSDGAAVASLFNNLGTETALFSPYYYESISHNMNAYCNVSWHKWKATFNRDYCSTPWVIASTVAAIILLLLTLIQTIVSIISL